MYGARATIVEAMFFYLRGEDNIALLQKHRCSFWDNQADVNGQIGLNYGLLSNFPQAKGRPPINQLETRVISKLVKEECSRNMTCILLKPARRANDARGLHQERSVYHQQ
jgi:thymidylate synthase